ncbi:MAG TPA: hypothetical protein VMR21_04195, partial [Vicinamibacteria bacterium]|nr:hypothetical protein [Vicinamibacteria bacterium]
WAAAAALIAIAVLNRDLYGFLARVRGPAFLAAAVPLHLLDDLYSGFGLLRGVALHLARPRGRRGRDGEAGLSLPRRSTAEP